MNGDKKNIKQKSRKIKKTPEQKKAEKLEKKELKKQKKLEKQNRVRLYDPEKMQGSAVSVAVGYFLRWFAIGFSLFGVCMLVCDAFRLTDVKWFPLLLYCTGAVCAFSLLFSGKRMSLAGVGIIAVFVGLFIVFGGNILTFYVTGAGTLINQVMQRLSDLGFAAAGSISPPYFGIVKQAVMPYGGIYALSTLLAAVFSAFSAKRTRLLPMVLLGGSLCVVCFTYNLCASNWGIACVLAGFCSTMVLASYDRIYAKHKKSKRSRGYSGYASALAGLLAMLVVLAPALAAKEPFADIPPISKPMEEARIILTTVLTGGNPKYNRMNTPKDTASAGITDVETDGTLLFNVYSGAPGRNIYLRSWIGSVFDPGKDEWKVLDSDSYDKMRGELNNDYAGFTGDDVTSMIYWVNDPDLFEEYIGSEYRRNSMLGATSTIVNVEYVNNTGLLFALPTTFDSYKGGLLSFESANEKYSQGASLYSDGMYRSSWLNLRKKYSVRAILPSYTDMNYPQYMNNAVRFYELFCDFINSGADYPNVLEASNAFIDLMTTRGITGNTKAVQYYYSLDRNEQVRFRRKISQIVKEYNDYVAGCGIYSAVTPTAGLEQVYNEIIDDVNAASGDCARLMCVVDYLTGNYEYSQTPAKPVGTYESDIDAFLLETKEGYCTQFATAATLLFRMLGYNARYVQGYIASDFYKADDDAPGDYISYVTDDKAHAWVEVYIPDLGWRVYETTPGYYENLYYVMPDDEPDDKEPLTPPDQKDPDKPDKPDKPDEPEKQEETEETEDPVYTSFDYRLALRLLAAAVAAAAVILLILWQIRRARRAIDSRNNCVERAIYGSFENRSEMNGVAGAVCDSIYTVRYIMGDRPEIGESPMQFAERVDHPEKAETRAQLNKQRRAAALPLTFTEITALLEKQEFGKAITREELSALGEYLKALISSEYKALGVFKKVWYRYIRFMI